MSAEPTGMIFDIQSYSVHDGPGCRTNVFFTGCPLKCRWCANPESWRPKLQFMFADRVCKWDQGCRACRDACPNGSIQFDENGKPSVDWKICNDCETIECTTSCAAGALKQTVRIMTVSDLVNTLRRDYNNWGSDGGVTFTGGEPLICKKDIIRLCEKHRDMAFHAFTNGTLIDDDFCRELLRVGNFFVSVSIEGFEEANDGRRGEGHFQKALAAMELMHRYKIPFGVSICYTAKNYKTVTSDEFLDLLISKGCVFAWYFHYMPVGMGASTDLLLTPEQRTYMKNRVREIRGVTGGKELYCIDFQNDGEFAGGCVAGGRIYCHINAAGDVEPCVFIHYSGANIREKSFLECLQQPLFLEYRKGQPFNGNHLRPCPMLENPDLLPEMVKRSGARSTDLEAPESAEHLCEKCKAYAACWQPTAEQLWDEEHRQ